MNKTHITNNGLSGCLSRGVGGQVLSAGSHDISRLSGHHGTVGVGHQAVEAVGVGESSHGVDGTTGSSVGSLGGDNLSSVGGDNSSVSMSHETPGGSGVTVRSSSVTVRSSSVGSHGGDGTAGVEVGSLGSSHGRGVGGHHRAVGVGNQLGGGGGHEGRENLRGKYGNLEILSLVLYFVWI